MRKALVILAAAAVAATPAFAATTETVAVKDDKFVPKRLTISKGDTVKWVWKGKSLHNVTVAKGPKIFRSGNRRKGHYSHQFNKVGTYRIVCTIHAPDMRMRVIVK